MFYFSHLIIYNFPLSIRLHLLTPVSFISLPLVFFHFRLIFFTFVQFFSFPLAFVCVRLSFVCVRLSFVYVRLHFSTTLKLPLPSAKFQIHELMSPTFTYWCVV